jgi:hypothetical protein
MGESVAKFAGIFSRGVLAFATAASLFTVARPALADQGGISFWVPGLFGSFAAAPLAPGLSAATIYYHTSVTASGGLAAAKQIEVGRLRPVTANLNVNLDVNLKAKSDMVFFVPQYVFDTKIFGGQFAVGMATAFGRTTTTLDGTLSRSLGPLTITGQGSITDSVTGFADLFPTASLRWNSGVHNLMIYGMTNIRVGSYDWTRLANTGLGFNSWDGGLGYTYLDLAKGLEFSATAGLTYNNANHDTNYRNGLDLHVDFGAAKFLSKQFYVGAVGYIYNQLEQDDGAPAFIGDTRSRVYALGPQFGYLFQPSPDIQGLFAVKGYYEFDPDYRADGWNVWVTLNFSPAMHHAEHKPVSTPRPQWK